MKIAKPLKTLSFTLLTILLLSETAWGESEKIDTHDKMYSMIADLHIETMGYKRYETIAGYGTSMKERGYAIYKGKKYYPDNRGFIIINTN